MAFFSIYRAAVALFWVACITACAAAEASTHTLPVFYFHGITSSAADSINLKQNLSTDARPFVALNFCESQCSLQPLATQIPLAIAEIRSIIANDSRFDNGYIFLAHSQGASIARAVIEEMDDHKVHTFVSLAGAVNGIFYGPQASDFKAGLLFMRYLSPVLSDPRYLDYSIFSNDDVYTGKAQIASLKVDMAHPELQDYGSAYNLVRSPLTSEWIKYNKYYPVYNNMKTNGTESSVADAQARRKANFLKLKTAYFFGSSFDETISPWQSSLLGQYNDVSSLEELEKTFRDLKIVSMKETDEYKQDLYGLKTLDERGGVFLHAEDNVSHSCWLGNHVPYGSTEECQFLPVWEKLLYPLLKTEDTKA